MSDFIVPSNPADRKKIQLAMIQLSDSYYRIEAERDFEKDVFNQLKEDYNIPPKFLRKMAKTYHKQTYTAVVEEQDNFNELYEMIMRTE